MKEKLKWYQEQAKRTCPNLGSDKLNLAHMVLGIFSEYEEYEKALDDVNRSEEVSDMVWYIANYCTFRNLDLSELYDNKQAGNNSFPINISILQDYVKKYIAYNKEINRNSEITILQYILDNIEYMYGYIEMENSLHNNINKLKVRFPDKFDENLAKNRNLDAERKELEK